MKHLEAKALVDTLGLTPAESLALRAVAYHETKYGLGWKDPAHDKKNNMGAITTPLRDDDGTCREADFPHGDSRREGQGGVGGQVIQYSTCFVGAPTPLDGFKILKRELYDRRPGVRAAAARGLHEVATEMRRTSYYLGTAPTLAEQIAAYEHALRNAAQQIVLNTHEPLPWPLPPKAPTATVAPLPSPPASAPLPSPSASSGSPATSSLERLASARADLPTLRVGAHGSAVRLFLRLAVKLDAGVYLPEYVDRVRVFQQAHKLRPDGVVGPLTWGVIISDRA